LAYLPAGASIPRYLTGGQHVDRSPQISPDGRRVLFASDLNNPLGGLHTVFDIFVVNIDGSGLLQLTQSVAQGGNGDSYPTWSPDGSRIAFNYSTSGVAEIWTMKSDGTQQARLIASADNSFMPRWAPDGSHIAFVRTPAGSAGPAVTLWVANADGSGAHQILQSSVSFAGGDINWSADSRRLMYQRRGDDGHVRLDSVDLTGNVEGPIPVPTEAYDPVVCGDASQIVYVHDPDGARFAGGPAGPDPAALAVVGVDGSRPAQVSAPPSGQEDADPSCAPI